MEFDVHGMVKDCFRDVHQTHLARLDKRWDAVFDRLRQTRSRNLCELHVQETGGENMTKPLKEFASASIRAVIWENEREKNGQKFTTHTVRVERRYRDENSEWQGTNGFRKNDLPNVELVVRKAFEFLTMREREPQDEENTENPKRELRVQTYQEAKHTNQATKPELEIGVKSEQQAYDPRAPPNHMSREEAWRIVGGLSKTEKMPCYSWGLSAAQCKRGAVLATKPGTVCSLCYARRGYYPEGHVQRGLRRRKEGLRDRRWVEAITALLKDQKYFRWFDSGDLQGQCHLHMVVEVCRRTPDCRHWLATREYGIVREFVRENEIPENLNIRLSADLINADFRHAPLEGCTVSTVSTKPRKDTHNCPASFGPFSMRSCDLAGCRACWNRSVKSVNYRFH